MPRSGDYQKERGREQRRRILAKLGNGPMSAQELADTVHLSRSGLLLHIQTLRDEKKIRIADYRMQSGSREIPLYGLGSEPDAVYVRAKFITAPNSFEVQREKVRQAILAQLKVSRATAPELAILTGLSNPTIRKYLPKMHSDKLIHRVAWVVKDGGGEHVAVWTIGDLPDAPKSKLLKKRVWSPLSDEQRDLLRNRREAVNIIRNAMKKPQNPFSALGL